MIRADIISLVGRDFLTSNIENDEYSYQKGLSSIGKNYKDYLLPNAQRVYKDVDLRFVYEKLTILIETKQKLEKSKEKDNIEQLQQYVIYEKELTGNTVVAILYGTIDEQIHVWKNANDIQNCEEDKKERVIHSLQEYRDMLFSVRNDKLEIVKNTYALNEILHKFGINEKIRSQFVGTCLLSLKNGLVYKGLTTKQIRAGIEEVLQNLLDKDLNKATKLTVLKNKVIDSQDVRALQDLEFQQVLDNINKKILPYINDKSSMGQDLLNLFFTTFNKYVGKSDKNQAFTPDHIVHFMCKVVGVNRKSVVLDPCCGSGAFLVRALTEAMADCDTEEERTHVKRKQIYGIEYDETAFGLSTTNMLIHGDGNSNIVNGNCFIENAYLDAGVNIVLMNPPYNAQRKHCNPEYVKNWEQKIKEDPSKGFHFVYEIAKKVGTGKLAVLLPTACAIGSEKEKEIRIFKKKMLEENTLDAVFSLPADMFHPGANAAACCMIFNLGIRHENSHQETFFGYFRDDGFDKKKNLGRIERSNGIWKKIEEKWLNAYFKRLNITGLSVTRTVSWEDEWLAEAYMETDYSLLNKREFEKTVKNYLVFQLLHEN